MPADIPRLIAGAMSGTSADGVDVALTQITGRGVAMSAQLLHHHAHSYPQHLRQRIFALRSTGSTTLSDLAALGRDVSLNYATAINDCLREANVTANDLAAIAAHGQTLFHDPPNTIQWLDPALLAARVGAAVVSDFRRADCAAGGQGAPLVPFADYIHFRHEWKHRVLVNIGGISNLSLVPAQCTLGEVIAFDCGPGNCLSDLIMRNFDPAGAGYDEGGELAATGQPIDAIYECVMRDAYFSTPPPKTTDVPSMNRLFLDACGDLDSHKTEDLLYTAGCITSMAIGVEIDRLPITPDEIILSGGGSRNRFLVDALRGHLDPGNVRKLKTSEQLGIPSEAKEALAFALLAAATLDGEPSNVPSATGASRPVVLGSITPKPTR